MMWWTWAADICLSPNKFLPLVNGDESNYCSHCCISAGVKATSGRMACHVHWTAVCYSLEDTTSASVGENEIDSNQRVDWGWGAIHQWLGQLMSLWLCPEPQSALVHSFQRSWERQVSGTSPEQFTLRGSNVGGGERPWCGKAGAFQRCCLACHIQHLTNWTERQTREASVFDKLISEGWGKLPAHIIN